MTSNATATIFNAVLDKVTRSEIFIPTYLGDVHYHESKGSLTSGGIWNVESDFRLRIPYSAYLKSEYHPWQLYSGDGWTLRKGDILVMTDATELGRTDMTHIKAFGKAKGYDTITITEFADNTVHGSDAMKHWRIGGK